MGVLPVTSGLIFVALVYLQLHPNHTTYYKKKRSVLPLSKKRRQIRLFLKEKKINPSASPIVTLVTCVHSVQQCNGSYMKKKSQHYKKKKIHNKKKKKKKKKK